MELKSSWPFVDELAAKLELHPWLVERALLWRHQQRYIEFWGATWPVIVNWESYPSSSINVYLDDAFRQYNRTAPEKPLPLMQISTAHERMAIRRIPNEWWKKFEFGEYQEKFEEEVKDWRP